MQILLLQLQSPSEFVSDMCKIHDWITNYCKQNFLYFDNCDKKVYGKCVLNSLELSYFIFFGKLVGQYLITVSKMSRIKWQICFQHLAESVKNINQRVVCGITAAVYKSKIQNLYVQSRDMPSSKEPTAASTDENTKHIRKMILVSER